MTPRLLRSNLDFSPCSSLPVLHALGAVAVIQSVSAMLRKCKIWLGIQFDNDTVARNRVTRTLESGNICIANWVRRL